ncbi:hypothetical protein LQ50_21975 [Halalkalibacter okhensis]|uniref:Uncharacterized protein n=1 Tax=Halalkalibacter okhensis TaxID=333138 RepID=A0A0B0I7A7_9BACI|nr:hypothetical protein LQ50_21975 [Halalkalibacter okhensis]
MKIARSGEVCNGSARRAPFEKPAQKAKKQAAAPHIASSFQEKREGRPFFLKTLRQSSFERIKPLRLVNDGNI